MIKHYQHTYLPYAQLWLLNDVNTPANGLENSKVCNKYQVNLFRNWGLFKQTGQVAQSSNWVLKLTFHKMLF